MKKTVLVIALLLSAGFILAGQNIIPAPEFIPATGKSGTPAANPSPADSLQTVPADSLLAVSPEPPVPQKSRIDSLLEYAATFRGKPYRLGAEGPTHYDCSSYVRAVFRGIGIELPRNTFFQIREGEPVINPQDLQKGDIVLFGKRQGVREVGHVGIVTDVDLEHCDFTFIHCGVTNGVEYQRYSTPYYLMRFLTGRRIISTSER